MKTEPLTRQAGRIAAFFESKGYEPCQEEPETLLPTELFLDHATRDVRSLFYMLADARGREFYMRPDFTVPLCRDYVRALRARPKETTPRRVFYAGSVFRASPHHGTCVRKIQVGIENFEEGKPAAIDSDILALTDQTLARAGVSERHIEVGDPGLFASLLDALNMSPNWRIRLKRLFRRDRTALPALLRDASAGRVRHAANPDNEALMETMREASPKEAEKILRQHLKENSIPHTGQRSLLEIAQGAREQALLSAPALPKETLRLLMDFLNIEDSLTNAIQRLEEFAGASPRIEEKLGRHIQSMRERMTHMEEGGVEARLIRFNPALYGGLGYYTGFVFAFMRGGGGDHLPLAGGGRYDAFLHSLGAPDNASGAGAAIYLSDIAQTAIPQTKETAP